MTLDAVFERGVELGRVRGFGGEPRESAGFGVFGVLIAAAHAAESRALAWFAAEASDATEFNSALEDVVERHRASATFALGFARHHIAATVHSPQPL